MAFASHAVDIGAALAADADARHIDLFVWGNLLGTAQHRGGDM